MAAFEIPNLRFSGIAGEAITRRRFVKPVSDNGNTVYEMAGAGEAAVGVSMNDPAINEVLEVADGFVIVEAGEGIVVGADVESDANGKAIALASGVKLGVAITATSADEELITIKTTV
jgi:hypothetical protein